MRPGAVLLVALLPLFTLGACSVNELGFSPFHYSEDLATAGGRRQLVRAAGLHLSTEPVFSLHLGWQEQRFLYPRIDAPAQLCMSLLDAGAGERAPGDEERRYADAPVLSRTRRTGLGFELAPERFFLYLGFQARHSLSIPRDRHAMVWSIGDGPEQACAAFTQAPLSLREDT